MARPRSFDEQEVLERSQALFWTNGYAGTSMEALTTATGLGKGSLYGAFGSKRELYLRGFDAYCRDAIGGVEAELQGPDDEALDRLRAHVRGQAASAAADTAHHGCMLAKGAAELTEHDPDVTARAAEAFAALEAILAREVAAAVRAGDLDPGVDPTGFAGVLLAVLRGLDALGKGGKAPEELVAVGEAAVAALLTR